MAYPQQYRYTKEHEWIDAQGDTAKIGITDYAQHELGDVVFVELPSVGKKLERGKSLGSVESVKAVSDLFTPMSGEVIEVNGALDSDPAAVNREPYGTGWLLKLRLSNQDEIQSLLSPAEYEKIAAE